MYTLGCATADARAPIAYAHIDLQSIRYCVIRFFHLLASNSNIQLLLFCTFGLFSFYCDVASTVLSKTFGRSINVAAAAAAVQYSRFHRYSMIMLYFNNNAPTCGLCERAHKTDIILFAQCVVWLFSFVSY